MRKKMLPPPFVEKYLRLFSALKFVAKEPQALGNIVNKCNFLIMLPMFLTWNVRNSSKGI